MNKSIQAKHVTDEQVLAVIDTIVRQTRSPARLAAIQDLFPLVPRKIIKAKCASMIRRQVIEGEAPGSRDDFRRSRRRR